MDKIPIHLEMIRLFLEKYAYIVKYKESAEHLKSIVGCVIDDDENIFSIYEYFTMVAYMHTIIEYISEYGDMSIPEFKQFLHELTANDELLPLKLKNEMEEIYESIKMKCDNIETTLFIDDEITLKNIDNLLNNLFIVKEILVKLELHMVKNIDYRIPDEVMVILLGEYTYRLQMFEYALDINELRALMNGERKDYYGY